MLYSAVGGILCYLVMLAIRRALMPKQIWVCSVLGAIAHNCGQMAVAVVVTRTSGLLVYLPVLLVSGILAGVFTGIVAQLLVGRLTPVLSKKTNGGENGGS